MTTSKERAACEIGRNMSGMSINIMLIIVNIIFSFMNGYNLIYVGVAVFLAVATGLQYKSIKSLCKTHKLDLKELRGGSLEL